MLRWWYTENRSKTLEKIHEIVEETIYNGDQAIRSETEKLRSIELREWEIERDKVTSSNNLEFMERLISEMEGMIQGINNLRKTYEHDVTICSKLEVESQNIGANIDRFKSWICQGTV